MQGNLKQVFLSFSRVKEALLGDINYTDKR